MKTPIIDIIKVRVEAGKDIKTAVIEYNFVLPEDKDITPTSFYGVEAKFNPVVKEGTAQLTYTL